MPPEAPCANDAPSYRLRLARPTDLAQLLALLPALTSRPQSPGAAVPSLAVAEQIFDQMQRQGNVFVAVAARDEGDGLLGSCTLVVVPNLTYGGRPWAALENVVVAPACRGAGIGTRLVAFACDLARRHGCYKVQLVSGPHEEQRRFYRRLGFDDARGRGFKYYL